jgi:uncharacterized repeat protein (TIGR01451 family)
MPFGPRVLSSIVVAAIALSAAPQAAHAAAKPTRIAVSVKGLPPGIKGSVKVRGPKYAKTLTRSRTLRVPRAGTYTFTVRQVKIRSGRKKVKDGSVALPAVKTTKVKVKTGRTAKAALRYGTIINANVKGLSFAMAAFTGDPTDPRTLTLPASTKVTKGAILTGKPTKSLPAGVFHRVTKVTRKGSKLVVTITPAHLQEAFPQLDIDTNLKFEPGRTTVTQARTSAFDPLTASLGTPYFRCTTSLADSHVNTYQSLGLDGKVEIHIPTTWGIPTGLPYGELALTLSGKAGIDVLLRKNSGCTAQIQAPAIPGSIPVGPVLVPTYVQFGLFATASIGSDIRQNAEAGFSLTAGMAFKGTSVSNTSKASAYANASASGSGKFAVGPSIRLAVGAAGLADVHFDAKPALAFSVALDASCSIDIEGGSQVGVSFGPFQINQPLPAPKVNLYRCPPGGNPPPPASTPTPVGQPVTRPALKIAHTGPLGAFAGQTFAYAIRVKNTGDGTARNVEVVDTLPNAGSLVDSDPAGAPADAGPNDRYVIGVGDLGPGEEKTVTVRWKAPDDDTSLTNHAFARADNADATDTENASVPIGTSTNCNPCGAEAAGTGLRNRDHGSIEITGVPAGATVGRAVLVWGILYQGEQPSNEITFQGHKVRADIASNVSGTLCWDDDNTVGYAADVTQYVTGSGNGTYAVTDPVRGTTQVDDEPHGVLPYTDGATLVVFYVGGGAQNQVLSDFSYDTNTDEDEAIARSFSGINSIGGAARLILAGPDGQHPAGETFTLTGATTQELVDTFDGSDPQDGPAFDIGSLWDTDSFDVSAILPAGQTTLGLEHQQTNDCIGVGAAVLQVSQRL